MSSLVIHQKKMSKRDVWSSKAFHLPEENYFFVGLRNGEKGGRISDTTWDYFKKKKKERKKAVAGRRQNNILSHTITPHLLPFITWHKSLQLSVACFNYRCKLILYLYVSVDVTNPQRTCSCPQLDKAFKHQSTNFSFFFFMACNFTESVLHHFQQQGAFSSYRKL